MSPSSTQCPARPLRVGIIAPPWVPVPPPAYGGTETVIDILARGLAALGCYVHLHASGDSTCPVDRSWTHERAVGLGAGELVAELRHVVDAYAVLDGMDIIHDHTLIGPLYADPTDPPVLTTNHAPFGPELGPFYQAISRRVGVIAISHRQAAAAGGIPLAGIIHHGVDLDHYPNGPGDGGYAVFLGRMSPDKGVHIAARAARAAGIPLRIAAKMREPAEHDYFAACVAPLVGGDVEYLGEVTAVEKAALLGRAACLLNPIAWPEPFGMVMIEALACGTPVITTHHGAAPEIVTDGITGFICTDETQLVDRLGHITDLDRGACRHAAQTRFSATRMARQHLLVYQDLLAGRSNQPGRDRFVDGEGDHARRRRLLARSDETTGVSTPPGPDTPRAAPLSALSAHAHPDRTNGGTAIDVRRF